MGRRYPGIIYERQYEPGQTVTVSTSAGATASKPSARSSTANTAVRLPWTVRMGVLVVGFEDVQQSLAAGVARELVAFDPCADRHHAAVEFRAAGR